MDKKQLILVAGAAGTQGGAVVDALLEKGIAVRAMVRTKGSEAALALAERGVEVVEASFDDTEALAQAAKGATGVFSLQMGSYPGNKGQETRHAKNLVAAARAAGVEQIVHTSVARAGEHEDFAGWQEGRWEPLYWLEKAAAIDAVKKAGFAYWTVIKPPLIMENLLPSKSALLFPAIAQGELHTPLEQDTVLDWVSPRDIGRFAAEAFVRPEEFNQKEFAIVGDKLTLPEVARVLSEVSGKEFEAGTLKVNEEEADLSAKSFLWMNVEGYKVDPQQAVGFGIRTESLKEYLERNRELLIQGYGRVQ